MSDKLHQINITYSNKEDRLLLRVTTIQGDEYRVWLTRRFSGLLLGSLNKEMEKYGGSPTIASSQQAKQMFKAGAFEKVFEEEKSSNYPLGESGFLAFGIKTAETPEGNLHLEVLPEKGVGVTLNLNQQLLYMLNNLILQGISTAQWQIGSDSEYTNGHVH